jgi:hypothetical protein
MDWTASRSNCPGTLHLIERWKIDGAGEGIRGRRKEVEGEE